MPERPIVLFFAISDFGYVNVVLATIYELLRQGRLDIHIASFAPLQPRLDNLVQKVKDENPSQPISPIAFHNLAQFPGFATWAAAGKDRKKADVPHPPGRNGAVRVALLTLKALAIMEPEQYLSLFDWSANLTRQLNPALVVIDPILLPVHDMVRTLKRRYAVLHPWNVADGLIPQQPWLAAWWKYPAFSTGFAYPVPWSQVLENMYCYWNSKKCRSHPQVVALNQARAAHGIESALGSFTPWAKDVPQITPSLPGADLPMHIPPNVHDCGPILVAAPPIESSDPDMLRWLQNGPTVLVSLGTHFEAYAETVREQALGLRILLEARPDIQVLWKLKAEATSEKSGQENLEQLLGREIDNGRVRVESWLKSDPVSILRSGHIVCSVHHGGANSYFEAAWAGVPQVVLAMWYDTFDYATRVEYLGIGTYGNRNIGHSCVVDNENYVAPTLIEGEEFGAALLRTVGRKKGDAQAMAEKAAQLGEKCRKSGGRVQSASIITDLCFEDRKE
ncbi:glycosyltransferase family 1 protein [Apiospora arundinis]|uniref:Glycosyltransferase family 1 protein n=1 Tax=Apiospora arundinis TaxID=335852 RepID=A0ABR2HN65_9PEZI